MFDGWMVVIAGACGAVVGYTLALVTHRLLTEPTRRYILANRAVAAITTGTLWALVWWRFHGRPEVAAYLVFAAIAVPLAVIDLLIQRLPCLLVLPLYPTLTALLGYAAIINGNMDAFIRATVGMVVVFTAFLVIGLATRGGLGAGDVRLFGVLGLMLAWHSWNWVIAGILAGLLLAAVYGAVMMLLLQGTRHTRFPLGPFMLAGTVTLMAATSP